MGPFESVLQWSGLDLSRSCVARSGSWLRSICRVSICFLICFTLFLKSLILMLDSSKPMTLEWAIGCVWAFMELYGLGSAIFIAIWTRSRFLYTLQEKLSKIQDQRAPLNGTNHFTTIYRRLVIGGVLYIAIWAVSSMKGILYEGSPSNFSEPFRVSYPFTLNSMYGLEPFVYLLAGFTSMVAMTMYSLVYAHVNRELSSFNEDLKASAKLQQLTLPCVLQAYSTRQAELIRLVKFVSQKTEAYVSMTTVFTGLAMANALYITAGFGHGASTMLKVLGFLWMNASILVVVATHRQSAKTQDEINNTVQILLADDFCQNQQDDQVWKTCRAMIDRAQYSTTKMYFMHAFAMDQYFGHKLLLILPNIGSLMVLAKKTGLV
ncbi:unnamed protein product [Nippostrongylus brasiliensis]|uniref:Gustatory receptor n=1 Tax=Nippostrongylus brasiliensis TaxID=27835 RepID=A0A0N4YF57_NIPBR|nr:unnamed protein product [Nippostrongylus brasiliensis]